MTRQALLVLGMHRSGTSALTRLLNLCGATLPIDLLPADEDVNAKGFWESRKLVRLNDDILAAAERSWQDLRPLPAGWCESATAQSFISRIVSVLDEEFGASPLFVLKDPRLGILLPLYSVALQRLKITPLAVIPVRHPLEVAASLQKRDGLGSAKALLLWLFHNLSAERQSREMKRSFVTYGALLSHGAETMERLGRQLGLAWPHPPETVAKEIDAFLAPDARHHVKSDAAFLNDAAIADEIKAAYAWLLAAAEDKAAPTSTLDALSTALDRGRRLYEPAIAALEDNLLRIDAERREWIDVAVQRYEVIEDLRREIERLSRPE